MDNFIHRGLPNIGVDVKMTEAKTESVEIKASKTEYKKHPYLQTFIVLAVLTAIEVAVSYADGPVVTAILLLLAVGKAALVGAVFMHIAYDKRPAFLVVTVFLIPLMAASILIFSVWKDFRGTAVA